VEDAVCKVPVSIRWPGKIVLLVKSQRILFFFLSIKILQYLDTFLKITTMKSFILLVLATGFAVHGFTIRNPVLFFERRSMGVEPVQEEVVPGYESNMKRSMGVEPVQEEVVPGYGSKVKRSMGVEPVQEEVVPGYEGKFKRSMGVEPVEEEVVPGYGAKVKRSMGVEPVEEEVVPGYEESYW
jgi:hypothetical protein